MLKTVWLLNAGLADRNTETGSTGLPASSVLKGRVFTSPELRWEQLEWRGISNSPKEELSSFVTWINAIYTLKLPQALVNSRVPAR